MEATSAGWELELLGLPSGPRRVISARSLYASSSVSSASDQLPCAPVDAAALALAPALGIPALPVDPELRRLNLEALRDPGHQVVGAQAEDALPVQLGQLAIRGAEPGDGLAPGLIERLRVDAAAQPAAAVQEVIALLHEHLAQTRLQHLLAALDA